MRVLTIIPTQNELDCFVRSFHEAGFESEQLDAGKLSLLHFPVLAVLVAHGGLGKVQFAVQTQYLIEHGKWEVAICAGAAGALSGDLSIGDVVIATETIEYDIQNRFGPPMLPHFPCAEQILERCRLGLRAEQSFGIHYGPIASGDEDVVEEKRRQLIQKRTGALAVAWEGAGGARACRFSDLPYVEIRGITDGADSEAAGDYRMNLNRAMESVARVVAFLAGSELRIPRNPSSS